MLWALWFNLVDVASAALSADVTFIKSVAPPLVCTARLSSGGVIHPPKILSRLFKGFDAFTDKEVSDQWGGKSK